MERKEFIKACGFACMGGALFASILESCSSAKVVSGAISDTDMVVPVSSFQTSDNSFKKYIVIHNEKLSYPICVYRFNENTYSALFMKCPHQGAELQVFGDRLQCPAHGSEFNDKGVVENGPADTNLRTFPVTIQKDQIYISLK
jgi:nitrite reductase/ring-hydroxylating ferredoxin subunit